MGTDSEIWNTNPSQTSVPHISSYEKEDLGQFGCDSAHCGNALNVVAGVRKMKSARPEMKFLHSWQTCDFAHLTFLNLACGYK